MTDTAALIKQAREIGQWMDVEGFDRDADIINKLCDELEKRVKRKWIYSGSAKQGDIIEIRVNNRVVDMKLFRNFLRGDIAPCDVSIYLTPDDDETIEDGFGSSWSAYCPYCGKKSMCVVRPGKVQCDECG